MNKYEINKLLDFDKDELITTLTNELAPLRAKIGISQKDVANILGVSRQTYWAIEAKKQKMSWCNFLSLLMLYGYNRKTRKMIHSLNVFTIPLRQNLNINKKK